jgi:2-hydroxy-3-keto-5-methylthiopentenyl-1-phosphate phosphatase
MPFPDYLDQSPRIIFFTDFDGTVTADDMCDWLVRVNGVQNYLGTHPF